MSDEDDQARKLARLEELKRKVQADEDLSEDEERELEEMADDPSLPVQAVDE